ncbi:MerR family transcriptional regulator [Cryobacterium melibiosiphilum]|uniref:MerR family transcriptional regulator n=1 Tax=Cryobacterium melibiosiphilum TaxID=995039 RepID=A0A3A5MNZ3_9MICO|nr:MerR family transcriptional regulator [Cryobacterium melibiosiphilum]RJT88653.1 MerR family transcriptional regulator [Cryobacterium melibiosiphilum]RJT89415.1 MerR family transcriptional regulator [Cryobacterium melibiosiphilum]
MKMAELSTVSAVAVATIKFYLRERLLPAGERTSPNQADYTEQHVRRLRLIRGLLDVGGLSVAEAHRVLDALDSEQPLQQIFGVAQAAVSEHIDPASVPASALARVDSVTDGWLVSPDNPGRLAAAQVIASLEAIGHLSARGWVERYAAAALLIAEADLDEIDAIPDREGKAETVVVGTVLGDALFSGLRRTAQEHVSALRYQPGSAAHHHPSLAESP